MYHNSFAQEHSLCTGCRSRDACSASCFEPWDDLDAIAGSICLSSSASHASHHLCCRFYRHMASREDFDKEPLLDDPKSDRLDSEAADMPPESILADLLGVTLYSFAERLAVGRAHQTLQGPQPVSPLAPAVIMSGKPKQGESKGKGSSKSKGRSKGKGKGNKQNQPTASLSSSVLCPGFQPCTARRRRPAPQGHCRRLLARPNATPASLVCRKSGLCLSGVL